MKVRRSILLICAAVAVGVALLVWFTRNPAKRLSSSYAETGATSEPSTHESLSVRQLSNATSSLVEGEGKIVNTNAQVPPKGTKAEQMKEGLATLNDEDVVFYGKVVDQFGSPVVNAKIDASIQVNNGIRVGTDRFSRTTDENGFFTINGYKGKSLGIWATKNGYVMATAKTSFVYSLLWSEAERHNPDPNNPAIIKMWKLQGAEPLVAIDQQYKFPYTGASVNFDLLAGKIVPSGGDIKITVSRSRGIVSAHTLQDWSVQVEPVNGGLIKADAMEARVTYAAPENGYQPDDTLIMSTNAPNKWFGGIHQTYFVQSRGGQVYSKVNFGIAINRNPDDYVWVEFRGTANTNHSRNWEADAPNSNPISSK